MISDKALKTIRVVTISGAAVVAAMAAYMTYPHDYPENATTDVPQVSFETTAPFTFGMDVSSLAVSLYPTADNGTRFETYAPPESYYVAVSTALTAWGSKASCGKLPASSCTTYPGDQSKQVNFPNAEEQKEGPAYISSFTVPAVAGVGGYPVTHSHSGAYASVQLPSISVDDYDGFNLGANIPVVLQVRLPGWKKYSWTGGPPPGDGQTPNYMSFVELTDAIGTVPAVIESGTSLPQQHTDSTRTLIAGALVGIVGAAAIALLQEIKRDGDEESKRERRSLKPPKSVR